MRDRCKDCKFWEKVSGTCHRFPPQFEFTSELSLRAYFKFPSTNEYSWCGEFAQKEKKDD